MLQCQTEALDVNLSRLINPVVGWIPGGGHGGRLIWAAKEFAISFSEVLLMKHSFVCMRIHPVTAQRQQGMKLLSILEMRPRAQLSLECMPAKAGSSDQ